MSLTALTKTPGGVKGSCAADVVGIDPVTHRHFQRHRHQHPHPQLPSVAERCEATS